MKIQQLKKIYVYTCTKLLIILSSKPRLPKYLSYLNVQHYGVNSCDCSALRQKNSGCVCLTTLWIVEFLATGMNRLVWESNSRLQCNEFKPSWFVLGFSLYRLQELLWNKSIKFKPDVGYFILDLSTSTLL